MGENKRGRQKKIRFLRIKEETLRILMDPERFDGKHGVALTLHLAILLQSTGEESPAYSFPEGGPRKLVQLLHEKYRWPEDTIDAALRMLQRNGLIENQGTRLIFLDAEHTFGSEWPSAASMRKRRQRQAQAKSGKTSRESGKDSRLAQLKRRANQRKASSRAARPM